MSMALHPANRATGLGSLHCPVAFSLPIALAALLGVEHWWSSQRDLLLLEHCLHEQCTR